MSFRYEDKIKMWAVKKAQWLRTLVGLAENPGSIPSTHIVAHIHLRGGLTTNDSHMIECLAIGSGTIRRCGLGGVGVVLLEKVYCYGGGL